MKLTIFLMVFFLFKKDINNNNTITDRSFSSRRFFTRF